MAKTIIPITSVVTTTIRVIFFVYFIIDDYKYAQTNRLFVCAYTSSFNIEFIYQTDQNVCLFLQG